MSEKRTKSKYSNVNVDTSLLETLNTILQTSSTDTNQLYEFLSNDHNVKQLVTIWSYFMTVNDHPHFTSCTIKLLKVLQASNNNEVLQPLIVPLIKDVLNNQIKVIYRGLSSMKPSITNPLLNLLSEIVKFKRGSMIEELLSNFDLNLAIIPKLLSASNFRPNFIEFWLLLLSDASYTLRKDLLLNYRKVNNVFYKFLTDDSVSLTKKIIETLDLIVLMESHYNKQTKAKIFGELGLSKFVALFVNASDTHLKTQLYDFLVKLTTNGKYGLNFADDKIWFRNTSGVAVPHSTFKIYNKLTFTMLLNLKPFEDDFQLRLIVEILSKVPELVPPYTQYLFQIYGALDPKLTSFWIGQMLLLQEIIRLPIPSRITEILQNNDDELSVELIVENLLPAPLTKSCLLKCFQCESLLLAQISLQVVLLFFNKLKLIIEFLEIHSQNEAKTKLLNFLVKNKLPDLNVVASSLNDTFEKHADKKLLFLSLTMVIKEYLVTFPTSSVTVPNNVYLSLMKDDLSGVELVTLDNCLEIKEIISDNNSASSKWWNGTTGKNSFFTNLAKLSSSNPAMYHKAFKILVKLTDQTIIFNKDVLCSQIFPLLQSLKFSLKTEELSKVWTFLDEVVSRAVRSPYKYLDAARHFSAGESMSPFLVALFEQWKFVEKSDNLNHWFMLLMRYFALVGESKTGMQNLFASNGFATDLYSSFGAYEASFIKRDSVDKLFFTEWKDDSYFEFVLVTPLASLDKRLPVNLQDLVGLIRRLEFIINDDSLELDRVEHPLLVLMEKLGNYISSSSLDFEKKYWQNLFLDCSNVPNDKLLFVSRILNELFRQIQYKSKQYSELVFSLLQSGKYEVVVSECCWALTDEQLLEITSLESSLCRTEILREHLNRNLPITECNWESENAAELQIIEQLVHADLVNANEESLIKLIKSDKRVSYPLIKSIIRKGVNVDFAAISSKELLIAIGSIIDPASHGPFLKALVDDTVERFYANFSLEYLQLISNASVCLGNGQLMKVLTNVLSNNTVTKHASNIFSIEMASIFLKVEYNDDAFMRETLVPWISKSLLYINQTIAQTEEIGDNFRKFVSIIEKVFSKITLWKFAAAILNTQLEILLSSKFINDVDILKYLHMVITKSNFKIDYNKSLQIFVNNELIPLRSTSYLDLRYHASMIINELFHKNIATNSTQTLQFTLLQFYHGLKTPDDLLLKNILIAIEASTSYNLVNHFDNWEFVEAFDEPFIKKEKSGLVVSINKHLVSKSIKNYSPRDVSPPHDLCVIEKHDLAPEAFTYDDEFLMMLIINNEELIEFNGEEFKVNLKRLVDSNLLQFIIVNLANENLDISAIAYKILASIYGKLEEGRTKDLYKVYLGNLLSLEEPAPVVVLMYANLVPILNSPNHHLYEKATRFLLSSSRLKGNEVPLFKYVSEPSATDSEFYYKHLTWFLENLSHNLKTEKDLKALNRNKVIEWVMNLYNNKFLNVNLQNLILSVILKIIKIGGLSMLIKSFSLLTWIEALSMELGATDKLVNRQFKLNYQKLSLVTKAIIDNGEEGENKRKLEDWFDHDLINHIKRVCN